MIGAGIRYADTPGRGQRKMCHFGRRKLSLAAKQDGLKERGTSGHIVTLRKARTSTRKGWTMAPREKDKGRGNLPGQLNLANLATSPGHAATHAVFSFWKPVEGRYGTRDDSGHAASSTVTAANPIVQEANAINSNSLVSLPPSTCPIKGSFVY